MQLGSGHFQSARDVVHDFVNDSLREIKELHILIIEIPFGAISVAVEHKQDPLHCEYDLFASLCLSFAQFVWLFIHTNSLHMIEVSVAPFMTINQLTTFFANHITLHFIY